MKKIILPLKEIKTIEKTPLLAVKVKIGSSKGYFILDTGSQINVVSDSLSNFFYEETTIVDKIVTINEDDFVKDVKVLNINDVKFGKKKLNLGYCCVMNINHFQKLVKPSILGLLGLNFFMENKAIINIKTKKLILYYNQ